MLSGCIKFIYVPVPSCPYGNIPPKSELKIKNISEQADSKDILKALAYDVVYLDGYSDQLLKLLEGYNMDSPEIQSKAK
jgi:hypothetical protein